MLFKILNLALFVMMTSHIIATAQTASPNKLLSDAMALSQIPEHRKDSFLLAQGDYFFELHNINGFQKAMQCYMQALKIAVEQQHQYFISKSYYGIANIFEVNNNLELASRYYNLNYHAALKTLPFNPGLILEAAYKIAATYNASGDSVRGSHYTLKMVPMLSWLKDDGQQQKFKLLIAHNFATIKRADDFLYYFKMVPTDAVLTDNHIDMKLILAQCQSYNALLHGDTAQIFAPLLNALRRTHDSVTLLKNIVTAYSQVGSYEKAFHYHALLDSLQTEHPLQVNSKDMKYHFLEIDNMLKEHDNVALRKNKEELTFRSSMLYIFSTFLFLCLLTTYYFFWKNRIFIQKIKEQNKLIKTHDDTTTILIKEIHHRIKNNLQIINSLIELQLNKADVDYQTSMMEIQSKMGTIALAHHLLYEMPDMKEVDLQAYFESMVEMTIKSLMPGFRSIETHIEMNCQKMTLEKLVTLAIAVNEMIINTIKHVFPKVDACIIELKCRSDETGFVFTYKDNGTIEKQENEVFKGTGMRLIRSLIHQMDGHIEISRGRKGNLEYFIRFQHKDEVQKYKPITEPNLIAS